MRVQAVQRIVRRITAVRDGIKFRPRRRRPAGHIIVPRMAGVFFGKTQQRIGSEQIEFAEVVRERERLAVKRGPARIGFEMQTWLAGKGNHLHSPEGTFVLHFRLRSQTSHVGPLTSRVQPRAR